MDPDCDPDCDTPMKNPFSDPVYGGPCPFRIGGTLGVLVLVTIVTFAFVMRPSAMERDHRIYKTGEVYTITHDDHLFVLYNGYKEGGILHHPSCAHKDCQK